MGGLVLWHLGGNHSSTSDQWQTRSTEERVQPQAPPPRPARGTALLAVTVTRCLRGQAGLLLLCWLS